MEQIISLPKMGLSMESAIIVTWHKKIGDHLQKGDVIAEVETDKATLELEVPNVGVILEFLVQEGDVVEVGAPIVKLGSESEPSTVERTTTSNSGSYINSGSDYSYGSGNSQALIPISPSARRKALELGFDYTQISGTGPRGRIIHEDILDYAKKHNMNAGRSASVHPYHEKLEVSNEEDDGVNITLDSMRRTIAKRMVNSVTTIPQFYMKRRINTEKVLGIRKIMQASALKSRNVKLSFNDFLIRAVAGALTVHPELNASFIGNPFEEDSIIHRHRHVNIGFAVALDNGLLVPVIHDAQDKTVIDIACERIRIIAEAKNGTLNQKDLQNGTFTISSLGSMEVDEFTAIVNPPESAILAVGSIVDQPIVVNGMIEIKPIVTITGSFDHRVIDGLTAAIFMNTLVRLMESDEWLLF